jgi:hypothetical protein
MNNFNDRLAAFGANILLPIKSNQNHRSWFVDNFPYKIYVK